MLAMHRRNFTEICGLLLGLFLAGWGIVSVVEPRETYMVYEPAKTIPHGAIEHVSKDRSRLYGILATLIGTGIVILSVYRRH
jgi:hypothetical protein